MVATTTTTKEREEARGEDCTAAAVVSRSRGPVVCFSLFRVSNSTLTSLFKKKDPQKNNPERKQHRFRRKRDSFESLEKDRAL